MRQQSGVTLVEVLVPMVIMALGMVGLAALQNFTLKYQLGSVHRAQLSGLLSDYAERVRANLGQAPGEVADSDYLFSDSWKDQASAAAAKPACTASNVCSDASKLAESDMSEWRARVRRDLPRGSVHVAGDAVRGLTVSFMWTDKEFVENQAGQGRQAPTCDTKESGLGEQTCCPIAVPAGVRCARFSVIP